MKSIGLSATLPEDIWNPEELKACLLRLSERVGRRARRCDYTGKMITLTVRYNDFETFSRQDTLPAATNDTGEIDRAPYPSSIRYTSRRASGSWASPFPPSQGAKGSCSSSGQPGKDKNAALAIAVDAANDRLGEDTVTHASTLTQDEGQRVISPARGPSGVRKSDA